MNVRKVLLFLLFISPSILFANGIAVTNVSIASQNTTEKYKMIKLDVAWSNSWRTYNYESNYDAAWIFIKYRRLSGGPWLHATLNYVNGTTDGHIKATSSDINTTSDGKGAFVFRANSTPTNFIGAASYKNMQLRWNYGVDGLTDVELVEISVQAIEMVYVPSGAFYVGDSYPPNGDNPFRFQDGSTNAPFYISSENPLTLGGSTSGNLSVPPTSSSGTKDDFSQTVTQILSATFPKGFKAFYCMKYEMSQDQYAEFLRKLTPEQAAIRYNVINYGTGRYMINSALQAEVPDRACNRVQWHDGAAYADWAGLRPMTELEFEKACRGPVYPVTGEYAWGNTNLRALKVIANDGLVNETDGDTPRANAHFNQGTGLGSTATPLFGPMRCGWTVGGSREASGDTFYGISDMSGNIEETVVSVGTAPGRGFNGTHGDGMLSSAGRATNSDWPGFNATDGEVKDPTLVRFKGGSCFGSGAADYFPALQISRRNPNFSAQERSNGQREPYLGMRLVRTAN